MPCDRGCALPLAEKADANLDAEDGKRGEKKGEKKGDSAN
jgi:hypothetical protein